MQVASWVEKADDKFGHLAIPHLTRYLLILQVVTYVLEQMTPGFTSSLLLEGRALQFGEVWRIITFMCVPAPDLTSMGFTVTMGPIYFFLYVWVTWTVGEGLEQEWGAGKVNIYYLVGIIALTVVSLFFVPGPVRSDVFIASLILPYGTIFPHAIFLLFFLIPIEARFLAIFFGVFMALAFALGFMDRAVVLASVLSYLLFFGPTFYDQWKVEQETLARRRRFKGD